MRKPKVGDWYKYLGDYYQILEIKNGAVKVLWEEDGKLTDTEWYPITTTIGDAYIPGYRTALYKTLRGEE